MDTGSHSAGVGVPFGAALGLSWTLVTAVVVMAMWVERASPLLRLASWLSLWLFTVVTPTLSALTIHRAITRLSGGAPGHDSALDELSRLRPFLLLSATMALLSACALIFGR